MTNFFTKGKNQISYLGDDFQKWFKGVEVKIPKKAKLYSKVLGKQMLDKEILEELKPSELTLGEVAYAIKNILKKEDWAIFYVRDKDNELRAVGVGWHGGGWSVRAFSVSGPDGWNDGYRVFSRTQFLDSSTPVSPGPVSLGTSDTLELRIKDLEEKINRIGKVLVF